MYFVWIECSADSGFSLQEAHYRSEFVIIRAPITILQLREATKNLN